MGNAPSNRPTIKKPGVARTASMRLLGKLPRWPKIMLLCAGSESAERFIPISRALLTTRAIRVIAFRSSHLDTQISLSIQMAR